MKNIARLIFVFLVFGCSAVEYEPMIIGKSTVLVDKGADPEVIEAIYLGLLKKTYTEEYAVQPEISLDSMASEVGGLKGNVVISANDKEACPKGSTHSYFKMGPYDCEVSISLLICIAMPEVTTREFRVVDYKLLVSPEEYCDG